MIIDCHTHIGRNEHIKANTKELLSSMDKANIDKAFVFAGALNACPTDFMLEQIAPHKDRLLGVAGVHPFDRDAQLAANEIDSLQQMFLSKQIVAAKFYLGYDHYYPNEIGHYLSALEEVGCPAIFHCGDCLNSVKKAKLKYAHPLGVDDVAVDYPKMNFIIAHIGYPWVRDTAEVCYKNDNVYTDISGFVYGEFKGLDQIRFKQNIVEFLSISSSDKLLFGTDWPISDQKSYLRALDDSFSETMTAQYLTRNVQKAFNLK